MRELKRGEEGEKAASTRLETKKTGTDFEVAYSSSSMAPSRFRW